MPHISLPYYISHTHTHVPIHDHDHQLFACIFLLDLFTYFNTQHEVDQSISYTFHSVFSLSKATYRTASLGKQLLLPSFLALRGSPVLLSCSLDTAYVSKSCAVTKLVLQRVKQQRFVDRTTLQTFEYDHRLLIEGTVRTSYASQYLPERQWLLRVAPRLTFLQSRRKEKVCRSSFGLKSTD